MFKSYIDLKKSCSKWVKINCNRIYLSCFILHDLTRYFHKKGQKKRKLSTDLFVIIISILMKVLNPIIVIQTITISHKLLIYASQSERHHSSSLWSEWLCLKLLLTNVQCWNSSGIKAMSTIITALIPQCSLSCKIKQN